MAESTRDVFDGLLTVRIAAGVVAGVADAERRGVTFDADEYIAVERSRWIERWERAEGKRAEWIDTRYDPPRIMVDDECVGVLDNPQAVPARNVEP